MPPAVELPLIAVPSFGSPNHVSSGSVGDKDNTRPELSGNKFPAALLEFGLNKRLNRRFGKQIGGLLIRGSEVRILPGACVQVVNGFPFAPELA